MKVHQWVTKSSEAAFSTWVWLSSLGIMSGSLTALMALKPWLPHRKLNPLIASFFGTAVKTTLSPVDVYIDRHLDLSRPSVYCQNHVSMLDGFLASLTIPVPFCGMMLAWHFKIPFYGWILKSTAGIPVYPHASGQTHRLIEYAKDRKAQGLSILAYPEAHRTLDGKVHEYRRGVFFMARDAGMPVVPMAVRGMYDINHKGSYAFKPGKLEVYFGPTLETKGLDEEGIRALALKTQTIVSNFVESSEIPDSAKLYTRY